MSTHVGMVSKPAPKKEKEPVSKKEIKPAKSGDGGNDMKE